jgi:dTMP kinase
LEEGKVVICDRYTDSTVAYQGYGRGIDIATIKSLNDTASRGLKPDLTILLDMHNEESLARKKQIRDRFEQEEPVFRRRVRQGYLKLAALEPQRWLVIDATKSRSEVTTLIWRKVSGMLFRQGV